MEHFVLRQALHLVAGGDFEADIEGAEIVFDAKVTDAKVA